MKIFKQHPKIWRRVASATLCMTLFGTNAFGALATDLDTDIPMTETTSAEEVWNSPDLESDSSEPLMGQESDEELNYGRNIEPEKADGSNDPVTDENENLSTETVDDSDLMEEPISEFDADLDGNSSLNSDSGEELNSEYTLNLTHRLQFTVDGEQKIVTENEVITLSPEDFVNNICDLESFSYDTDQVNVIQASALSLEDFDDYGQGSGVIDYEVSNELKVVAKEEVSDQETVEPTVFKGPLIGYTFISAKAIRIKAEYQYSKTGGLAGVNAAKPVTLETIPEESKDENGRTIYTVKWDIPTLDGFRIVLNPDPLNEFLVSPPDGTEDESTLKEKLENGDFDVDIENKQIYYYQENSGQTTNPTYNNIYSDKYNKAWENARSIEGEQYSVIATGAKGTNGATPLENPELVLTLTEEQLNTVLESQKNNSSSSINLTVFYRRNATWYTVKHWVPKNVLTVEQLQSKYKDAEIKDIEQGDQTVSYVCVLVEDRMQGRVGTMTRAVAKTATELNVAYVEPLGFSQQLIVNPDSEGKGTEVDIYYRAGDTYRVIFDTNYTYIPRQQIPFGESVKFDDIDTPSRTGYEFNGWQYLKNTANDSGPYSDNDYEDVPTDTNDKYTLTIDAELVSKAKFIESDGVYALYLVPKWKPAQTKVRVIFWTENLQGGNQDIQAQVTGASTYTKKDYYTKKYENYSNAPQTVSYDGTNGSSFSNVGSFEYTTTTDSSLIADNATNSLESSLNSEIAQQFSALMGKESDEDNIEANNVDISKFYKLDTFRIFHESQGDESVDSSTTTAAGDGKTTIYVYYTRKIYKLQFHYYGTVNGQSDCIALNTKEYSYYSDSLKQNGSDTELNYGYYHITNNGKVSNVANDPFYNSSTRNRWQRTSVNSGKKASTVVPQTITITAKYGANLNEVWPIAQSDETANGYEYKYTRNNNQFSFETGTSRKDSFLISWGATAGKYRNDSMNSSSSHYNESTIMGVYGAMNSEIIADPDNPNITHHLVGYWNDEGTSYYRYNHCLEIPGLVISDTDSTIKKVSILDTSTNKNDKNRPESADYLYLVPFDENDVLKKYGFTDLMRVSYDGSKIQYDTEDGKYYAVRQYKIGNQTKYYAISKRVETVSRARIAALKPSARLHLTNVNLNGVADHSSQYIDDDGAWWKPTSATYNLVYIGQPKTEGGNPVPYDLYFYYDRDPLTITYTVPTNLENAKETEYTLGTVTLPYGTTVTKDTYGFALNYLDSNTNEKYTKIWKVPTDDLEKELESRVCPDRSENGQAVWNFKGWGLGPAGINMQWTNGADDPASQTSFQIEGNLRLYAIWDIPSYKVTFELQGGSFNGSTDDYVQSIRANTRYSASGIIPRPLRTNYVFDGWYTSTDYTDEFDFDEPVISDKTVYAKWNAVSAETFSYSVYYLTQTPQDKDKENKRVYLDIDDSGKVINVKELTDADLAPEGAPIYYVLQSDTHSDQLFISNSTMSLSALPFVGYVPKTSNESITMTNPGDLYNVIFIYDPVIEGMYTMKFVLANTELTGSPTQVGEAYQRYADQTAITPNSEAVEKIISLGYRLVNRNSDTAETDQNYTYQEVTDYKTLKWYDANGAEKGLTGTLSDTSLLDTIVYLVEPIPYTITYSNADDSPAGAIEALGAVTALINTSSANAKGKNPTLYTTKETIKIDNPKAFFDEKDHCWYSFDYWELGDQTSEAGSESTPDKTYKQLSIGAGTVGALSFIAHWKANTGGLNVSKTVTGSFGDQTKDFDFSITLDDSTISGTFGDLTFENGVANFTLRHKETKKVILPAGMKYTIVETEANTDGYETTVTVTDVSGNALSPDQNENGIVKGSISSDEGVTNVAYTNTKNAKPVTGIDGQNPAWILGLAAGVSLVAVLFWMKKFRKYRYEKE